MPNYIRVKQINPNELSGFFVDSISSESGLLLDLAEQAALNIFSSGAVLLTGNQTISGNKTFANNLNVSGDLTVAGTLRYNEIIDTTVTGNISGYTGIFQQVYANNLVYNTGNQTISGDKSFVNKIYLNNENDQAVGGTSLEGNISGISLKTFQQPTDIKIRSDFVGGNNEEVISIRNSYYTDAIFGPSINTAGFGDQIVIYQTGSTYGVASSRGPYLRLGDNNIISEKSTSKLGIGTLFPIEKVHISGGNLKVEGTTIATNLVYNTGNQNIFGIKTFISNQIFSGNINVSGTGTFNALDLNNIDNLSLSGVDITITSGVVALTNRPTVNGTGVLLSGQSPAISDSLVTHIRPSGTNNVFVSSTALASTSIGSQNNIAVGVNALTANAVGDDNVAMGHEALYSNINGNGNIGIGRDALKNANSPDANICIGTQAGDTIQAGGSNIIIGHEADVDDAGRQRCIVLGRSAVSPALDGSLSIGGDGANAMNGLTTGTAGAGATSYLRIWLNGLEYRILIQRA